MEDLENIGLDCPCYDFGDCSTPTFDIGDFMPIGANNGKLTITVNGNVVAEFYADQSENTTADIDLSGYATSEDLDSAKQTLEAKIDDKASISELEDEASLREEEDDRLSDEIDDLGEELNTEVNARTQADIALGNRIDLKADITALTAETTNRENADIELQSQIDAITSQSDVVDIVGTYAELQAYDTSHLGDNDIVKVLTDSTHDNAPSYFRWNKTEQTWSYVGSESVAYTKAEADDRFVPKTRTINNKALSENITLTTNDLANDSGYLTEADLTDYVKNTDYATTTKGGVVKPSLATGSLVNTNGVIMPTNIDYEDYEDVAGNYFVGKGTLENVLEERKYLMPEFVQELPATGADNKLYLTPAEEQPDVEKNVSGKEIEITDASEGDLINWQLKGDTEQASYTGKNLLNQPSSWSFTRLTNFQPLPAGIYYISCGKVTKGGANDPRIGDSSSNVAITSNMLNVRINFTGNNLTAYSNGWNWNDSAVTSTVEKLIITAEPISSIEDYEPYVGGKASPSPDYPQEVKTVTGRNTITLKSGNLFGLEGKTTSGITLTNNSGRVSITGTSASATSPSLANGEDLIKAGTYTLSLSKPAPLVLNLVATTASGNVSFMIAKGQTSATNTLTSDSTSQELFCGLEAKTYNEAFDIMLSKGSQVSPFQPYSKQEAEINLGKNLFDKDTAEVISAYIDSSVTVITTNDRNRIVYIPCEPNSIYTISALPSPWARQIAYTNEKPVAGVQSYGVVNISSNGSSATISTGNNARYIIFRLWHTLNSTETLQEALDGLQIERGSKATSYAPYFDHIGKNLFDKNKEKERKYLDNNGDWVIDNFSWFINQEYSSIGAEKYAITLISPQRVRVGQFRANGSFIKRDIISRSTILTTENDAAKIVFSADDTGNTDFSGLQIERGDSATPYEPFIRPELYKLGDYQDRIYKDGDSWKIEKQTGKTTYIGESSENWQKFEYSGTYIWRATTIPSEMKASTITSDLFKSNYFTYWVNDGTAVSTALSNGQFGFNATATNINFKYTSISELSNWKTWLANNPVTIYYALATPYTATITYQPLIDQLNELETLTTQKGFNAVSTDTELVQPFLDFTYFRPDPTVTKDEWLWIENHYEQLGGERRYTHNMSVNHNTAQGHWDYAFTIVGKEASHYTQLAQVAYYLFREHAGLTIPVSGTYTEGNVVYLLTKITASSLSQVTIEMRKLSDGTIRTISTGAVPVQDTIS